MLGLFKKQEFMEWQDYRQKIEMIDDIMWSQRVRRRNLQNLGM